MHYLCALAQKQVSEMQNIPDYFQLYFWFCRHLGIEETFIDDNSDRSNKFEMRAEVGLLSHNVKFEGSKDSQWHDQIEACEEGFDTGL